MNKDIKDLMWMTSYLVFNRVSKLLQIWDNQFDR